jgi:hypothetical protein
MRYNRTKSDFRDHPLAYVQADFDTYDEVRYAAELAAHRLSDTALAEWRDAAQACCTAAAEAYRRKRHM